MIKIDEGRFESVVRRRHEFHRERGTGRTFAACHKLAWQIAGIDQRSLPENAVRVFFYPCPSKAEVESNAYELLKHLAYFSLDKLKIARVFGRTVVGKVVVLFVFPKWDMRQYIVDEIVDTFGEFESFATIESRDAMLKVRVKPKGMYRDPS
jgi:hypothetical protein